MKTITFGKIIKASSIPSYGIQTVLSESFRLGVRIKGISKNPYFYDLNPSPVSGREGYKEFLEMPYTSKPLTPVLLLTSAKKKIILNDRSSL